MSKYKKLTIPSLGFDNLFLRIWFREKPKKARGKVIARRKI
jgi:hypothetical protein